MKEEQNSRQAGRFARLLESLKDDDNKGKDMIVVIGPGNDMASVRAQLSAAGIQHVKVISQEQVRDARSLEGFNQVEVTQLLKTLKKPEPVVMIHEVNHNHDQHISGRRERRKQERANKKRK